MEAWPAERTKRSRLGQMGSCGSKRRNCCHRQYATGASAIGVPGCPELAACTASIDSVRIVLMHVVSRSFRLSMCGLPCQELVGQRPGPVAYPQAILFYGAPDSRRAPGHGTFRIA